MPKFVFPDGAMVGCEAGFLNVSRIKGSHAAIKSGMLAAEAAFAPLEAGRHHDKLSAFTHEFERSWLHAELNKARHFKQWFKKGRTLGTPNDWYRVMATKRCLGLYPITKRITRRYNQPLFAPLLPTPNPMAF